MRGEGGGAVKRRRTPAQRRAAARLGQIALSLRPAREAGLGRGPAEAAAPRLAAFPLPPAVEDRGDRGRPRGRRWGKDAEPPAVLARPDPLPTLPVVGLGQELAAAIARLDALMIALDGLRPRPAAPGETRHA
jgi:hypothetical protein